MEEYGKAWCQPTYYGEGEAERTHLLTQLPMPNMPALSQGDDTRDDWSREGAAEGAVEWITLITQPPDPDIPSLSQGDNNATDQFMEGGVENDVGTPLLTHPPASETPTLGRGDGNTNTRSIYEGLDPTPPDEMEIIRGIFLGDA